MPKEPQSSEKPSAVELLQNFLKENHIRVEVGHTLQVDYIEEEKKEEEKK